MKLAEILQLDFEIQIMNGMRIAGSGGDLEIGATVQENQAIIRDALTGEPYVPGSSLKGKLRSLAEKVHGSLNEFGQPDSKGLPCQCGLKECKVCPLFGAHMNPKAKSAPTRIRVRDAYLTDESRKIYLAALHEKGQHEEHKTENIVYRTSGVADHPRTGERVPPGTIFGARIIVHIYEGDSKDTYLKTVQQALSLLEEADSLGGSGSRGYGEIKLLKLCSKTKAVSDFTVDFKAC
jgi:CRISPR-associated protein Csm3